MAESGFQSENLALNLNFGPQAKSLSFPPASQLFYPLCVCACSCPCLCACFVPSPQLLSLCHAVAYLLTSCGTAASSLSATPTPHSLLSPSSLYFNPTLPEPVRMSSGLLCKRHGRGLDLVLGCHTSDQPLPSCSPPCVVVTLECFSVLAGCPERVVRQ